MTVSTRTWRAAALAVLTSFLLPSQRDAQLDAQQQAIDPALLNAYRWRSIGPDRGGRSIAVAGVKGRPREAYFGAVGGGLWKTTDARQQLGAGDRRPDHELLGRRGRRLGLESRRRLHRHGRILHSRQHHARRRRLQVDRRRQDLGERRLHERRRDLEDPHPPDQPRHRLRGGVRQVLRAERRARRVQDHRRRQDLEAHAVQATTRPAPSTSSIDANNPNVLYAALWEAYRIEYQMSSGGPGSGLFKSTDGGETWTEITRNPGMPAGMVGRIGVAVTEADSNRVYALVENENGGLFVSDDAGASWTLINASRAHPAARVLLHARVRATRATRTSSTCRTPALFRSTDGGKTHDADRPEHARRSSRPVGRSGRSAARHRRQRRRRRDHLRRSIARAELERAGFPDRAVVSRDHHRAPALPRLRRAAGQQHAVRAEQYERGRRRRWWRRRIPPVAPYQVGGGEPGYIAPHADRSRTSSSPAPTTARS